MPLYEYSCETCGTFENLQSSFTPIEQCPTCESGVYKILSNCTFRLKGENWPSKEAFKAKVKYIEKGLEKDDNRLLAQGHVMYPPGHEAAGDII